MLPQRLPGEPTVRPDTPKARVGRESARAWHDTFPTCEGQEEPRLWVTAVRLSHPQGTPLPWSLEVLPLPRPRHAVRPPGMVAPLLAPSACVCRQ